MIGFKLEGFEGLQPRTSERLLSPTKATTARNTKLLQGELRGFRTPRELADLTGESITIRKAFRVPDTSGFGYADEWLSFDSQDVDVVRSPIVNDQYDRYYWAGDGRPMYNTADRIFAGDPPFFLGVPIPTVAPTVTPTATVYADEVRAYVYTFVSAYGEEGQPSPPTLATGDDGVTWNLTGMQTTVPDAASRNITKKNIYRTVPGNNSSVFFFVAQVDVGDATYADNETDFDVALAPILESQTWAEPITTLQGMVLMPNGYLVGWDDRRVVMSEPYRPHAWPAEYELATEFGVVGMVVWGSTIVMGTQSNPYLGQGNTPQAFTMQKMDAVEPCLSRQGMVATIWGAYYPSINGLTLVNSSGVQNITQDILTKEEWFGRYDPANIFAAQLGIQYIAFNGTIGFVFNPTEEESKLVELDAFTGVNGIETDPYSGNVLLLMQDRVWDWDPEVSERLFWRWKSKLYQTPKPVNLGALRLNFEPDEEDVGTDVLTYYQPYNDDRFDAGPLNTLAGHPLCGDAQGIGLVPGWTEPELRMPLGGSLLYPINFQLFQESAVRVIVYEGRDKRVVLDTVVVDEKIVRLPAGFKSDLWQFELIGNTTVYSMQVAETAKGLAGV